MAVLKQEQKINLTTKKQHPRLRSMKDFYRKLKRNKAALVGGYLILFLTIVSLIGPYFLSNGINDVDYTARLQPPSAEYWLGTDQHGPGYIFPNYLRWTDYIDRWIFICCTGGDCRCRNRDCLGLLRRENRHSHHETDGYFTCFSRNLVGVGNCKYLRS